MAHVVVGIVQCMFNYVTVSDIKTLLCVSKYTYIGGWNA